jgi:hypothetical protein
VCVGVIIDNPEDMSSGLSMVLCTQVNMMQAFSQGPKRGRPILVQQYIYSKGGGGGGGFEKTFLGKPLKFTLLRVSICSKLVRNFSNTLGFVSLCRYASLLNYDIFIQPGTPSN